MVIHYPPAQLRYNSDQPTAITGVLVATSGSSHTGEIPLGTPTCSVRTRHGRWALYPHGTEVTVVWPGGAITGSSARSLASSTASAATGTTIWTAPPPRRSGGS
jgi:hypothetical protein